MSGTLQPEWPPDDCWEIKPLRRLAQMCLVHAPGSRPSFRCGSAQLSANAFLFSGRIHACVRSSLPHKAAPPAACACSSIARRYYYTHAATNFGAGGGGGAHRAALRGGRGGGLCQPAQCPGMSSAGCRCICMGASCELCAACIHPSMQLQLHLRVHTCMRACVQVHRQDAYQGGAAHPYAGAPEHGQQPHHQRWQCADNGRCYSSHVAAASRMPASACQLRPPCQPAGAKRGPGTAAATCATAISLQWGRARRRRSSNAREPQPAGAGAASCRGRSCDW